MSTSIENTAYKRSKLLILYRIACSDKSEARYTRDEIVEKIETVRADQESNRRNDLRFSTDQLLRDLINLSDQLTHETRQAGDSLGRCVENEAFHGGLIAGGSLDSGFEVLFHRAENAVGDCFRNLAGLVGDIRFECL